MGEKGREGTGCCFQGDQTIDGGGAAAFQILISPRARSTLPTHPSISQEPTVRRLKVSFFEERDGGWRLSLSFRQLWRTCLRRRGMIHTLHRPLKASKANTDAVVEKERERHEIAFSSPPSRPQSVSFTSKVMAICTLLHSPHKS